MRSNEVLIYEAPPASVHVFFFLSSLSYFDCSDLVLRKKSGIMAPNPDKSIIARQEAPKFAEVTWYKDAGLRKLYALCAVIIMSSATTGFDGYVSIRFVCMVFGSNGPFYTVL